MAKGRTGGTESSDIEKFFYSDWDKEIENRLTTLETRIKMLMWGVGVVAVPSIIAMIYTLIRVIKIAI